MESKEYFEKKLQEMMESQYTMSSDMFADMESLDENGLMKVHKAFREYIGKLDGDDYLVDRYIDDYEQMMGCMEDDRWIFLKIATNSFKSVVTYFDAFNPAVFFELSAVVKKAIRS